ncbi:MAG: general secretion pathway protein GspD [Gallionellales bacterium GWA2_60_142]|nr:MAG: general secretion pathway protein GspD [Gallionellales bacterium GWA2_60_142]
MRVLLGVLSAVVLLAGCATPNSRNHAAETIQREMNQAVQQSVQPAEVNNALLPPLSVEMPAVEDKPLEPRFDLVVSATPVQQVFMAIVSGTRYSMLLHPEVEGSISLNLKDVTVFEALEAIREMYGYDYKMSGDRIYVQPLTMQTRIFQVNYLTGSRAGTSSVRVTSSALSDSSSGSTGTGAATNQGATIVGGGDKALKFERGNDNSSKITTTTSSDFWDELSNSLSILVGKEDGRSVVISPMSGVIVVRAMPDELKNVAAYLKASQISIERQVILEAKIIEVQLNVGFQSGVNWGAFKNNPNSRTSIGQLSPGATLSMNGSMTNGAVTSTPGTDLSLAATAAGQAAGSLFGLAFQTSNFAALLSFLESQGNVHVLSSPRIATLNNQKAVLKVGTDEFFVTEISGGTQATANVAGTAPTVKVQPFFSGIALDVTPRIDQNNEIILHVHPSVSTVSTVNKTLNLGTGVGTYNLPLASSSVSETDSIVRARDGQIVAIGGLMRQATISDQSGLPGMPKQVFGQTSKTSEKRELVILLKPTVVDNDKDWSQDITGSRDRVGGLSGQGGRP